MRKAFWVFWLVVFVLSACNGAASQSEIGAQIDPPFPPAGALDNQAKVFALEKGWYDGQQV